MRKFDLRMWNDCDDSAHNTEGDAELEAAIKLSLLEYDAGPTDLPMQQNDLTIPNAPDRDEEATELMFAIEMSLATDGHGAHIGLPKRQGGGSRSEALIGAQRVLWEAQVVEQDASESLMFRDRCAQLYPSLFASPSSSSAFTEFSRSASAERTKWGASLMPSALLSDGYYDDAGMMMVDAVPWHGEAIAKANADRERQEKTMMMAMMMVASFAPPASMEGVEPARICGEMQARLAQCLARDEALDGVCAIRLRSSDMPKKPSPEVYRALSKREAEGVHALSAVEYYHCCRNDSALRYAEACVTATMAEGEFKEAPLDNSVEVKLSARTCVLRRWGEANARYEELKGMRLEVNGASTPWIGVSEGRVEELLRVLVNRIREANDAGWELVGDWRMSSGVRWNESGVGYYLSLNMRLATAAWGGGAPVEAAIGRTELDALCSHFPELRRGVKELRASAYHGGGEHIAKLHLNFGLSYQPPMECLGWNLEAHAQFLSRRTKIAEKEVNAIKLAMDFVRSREALMDLRAAEDKANRMLYFMGEECDRIVEFLKRCDSNGKRLRDEDWEPLGERFCAECMDTEQAFFQRAFRV